MSADSAWNSATQALDEAGVIEALRDLAVSATAADVVEPDSVILVTTPPGSSSMLVNVAAQVESAGAHPHRRKGTAAFTELGSLSVWVSLHRTTATAVWANRDTHTVTAVINGDEPHSKPVAADTPDLPQPVRGAGWGDHRAVLVLPLTPEWLHWARGDRKWFAQADFAEHVELGLSDIVAPPAADMLELAQTMEGTTSAAWRSSQRLANGERKLSYDETVDARAGQHGDLTVPEQFTLGIRPYAELSEGYRVQARLRYRVNGGALHLMYVLDRPDRVLRDAWAEVVAALTTDTGLPVFAGTPALARS